jgi:hypothetical protein
MNKEESLSWWRGGTEEELEMETDVQKYCGLLLIDFD